VGCPASRISTGTDELIRFNIAYEFCHYEEIDHVRDQTSR
jgi:hypothetical protein